MRRITGGLVVLAASLAAVAAAQAQSPIAGLVKILPPEPGKQACYARSYDEAHLKRHPQQRISRMTFLLQVKEYDLEGRAKPPEKLEDRVYYVFGLSVQRRGEKRTLRTSGNCHGDGKIGCAVDCDGGGVDVTPKGESLLVSLDDRGIQMFSDCDGNGVWVKPGADDKLFRIDPVPAEACKALAKELE